MANAHHRRQQFKEEMRRHIEEAGQDLERVGDDLRRRIATAMRTLAPGAINAGVELGRDLQRTARMIDAKLFREGKQPSAA